MNKETSNKKRILITGGTGYLGSSLINTLKYKYDFTLLVRESSSFSRIENMEYHRCYTIEQLSSQVIEELDIDIILHCATHYGRRNGDAVNTLEANLLLPLTLISMFRKTGKPIKFINTDTILDKHINVYSLSKNQFKDWMIFFSEEFVFLNLQLEHFYGPRDDKTKFVSFLFDAFISNVPFIDLTKGEQNRYFTYIDDIVAAFDVIIEKIDLFPNGFNEFQISSDEPAKLMDFVLMVKSVTGNDTTRLNFGAIPYRKGELMNFPINSTALKNLGWSPKITLEEGLRRTYEIEINKL